MKDENENCKSFREISDENGDYKFRGIMVTSNNDTMHPVGTIRTVCLLIRCSWVSIFYNMFGSPDSSGEWFHCNALWWRKIFISYNNYCVMFIELTVFHLILIVFCFYLLLILLYSLLANMLLFCVYCNRRR